MDGPGRRPRGTRDAEELGPPTLVPRVGLRPRAAHRRGALDIRRRCEAVTTRLRAWVAIVSIALILLSAATVAYSRWTESRYRADRPPAPPEETLPERLPIPSLVPSPPRP